MYRKFFLPARLLMRISVGRICRLSRAIDPALPVSKDVIELAGVVEESYPNATFRIRVTSEQAKDHQLLCTLAGRMRMHRVRILPGDRVKVEMTPYDLEKGRIVYRFPAQGPISMGTAAPAPTPAPLPRAA